MKRMGGRRWLGMMLALFGVAPGAAAQAADAPFGVPLYVFELERPPEFGGTGGLRNDMLQAIQHPGVAGAMMLMCWKVEEPKRDEVHFTDGADRTLVQLAHLLKPSQHLIIGMRAGNCAPPWLHDLGVSMLSFYQAGLGGEIDPCKQITVAAPYNPIFIDRYVSITRRLWQAMATLKLSDGSTLQSHVVALKDASMATRSAELGIHAHGCAHQGQVFESTAQVLQSWASLPGDDAFRPEKILPAYMKILDGLFSIVPPGVLVSQAMTQNDKYAWPSMEPHERGGGKAPIMESIVHAAAQRYGGRMVFAWNELSLGGRPQRTPPPAPIVIEAGRLGAGMDWQLNGNAHGVTSCYGRHDQVPATPKCFADIISYGMSLVPPQSNNGKLHWIEIEPLDVSGPQPLF